MSQKEVVLGHRARSLGRAASFAWQYKIFGVAVEFLAFLGEYSREAISSPIDVSLLDQLIGVVRLSGSSTLILELLGLNILLSWVVVCSAAFVSRFHPLVTGLCAGLCMWPYWSVVHSDWPVRSTTIFFALLGSALATLAGWLAWKGKPG